jgi:hypothetical protein
LGRLFCGDRQRVRPSSTCLRAREMESIHRRWERSGLRRRSGRREGTRVDHGRGGRDRTVMHRAVLRLHPRRDRCSDLDGLGRDRSRINRRNAAPKRGRSTSIPAFQPGKGSKIPASSRRAGHAVPPRLLSLEGQLLSRGQPFWGLDGHFFHLGDLFGLFLFDGGHLGFELPFALIVNRDQVDGYA